MDGVLCLGDVYGRLIDEDMSLGDGEGRLQNGT